MWPNSYFAASAKIALSLILTQTLNQTLTLILTLIPTLTLTLTQTLIQTEELFFIILFGPHPNLGENTLNFGRRPFIYFFGLHLLLDQKPAQFTTTTFFFLVFT